MFACLHGWYGLYFCVVCMVAWHSCMACMILDCISFLHDIYFVFLMTFILLFSKITFIHLLNLIILCFCRKLTKGVWHRRNGRY